MRVDVKLFLSKEAYKLDQIFIATFQEIACLVMKSGGKTQDVNYISSLEEKSLRTLEK